MNKVIKITILVLVILSVSFSGLFYFDLWPFSKKSTQVNPEITTESTELPITRLPFPCLILDDEYCPQGEPVYDGEELIGLGFILPEGTKIYAPFKGLNEAGNLVETLVEINGKHYSEVDLRDISSDDWGQCETQTYFFAMGFHDLAIEKSEPTEFEKGQPFALVGASAVNKLLGDYNLILSFRDANTVTGEWSNNLSLLKEFFNYVSE